mgnify:FL=1
MVVTCVGKPKKHECVLSVTKAFDLLLPLLPLLRLFHCVLRARISLMLGITRQAAPNPILRAFPLSLRAVRRPHLVALDDAVMRLRVFDEATDGEGVDGGARCSMTCGVERIEAVPQRDAARAHRRVVHQGARANSQLRGQGPGVGLGLWVLEI